MSQQPDFAPESIERQSKRDQEKPAIIVNRGKLNTVTIQLLLAPAGAGKTAHIIARIRALPPLTPICVLVPDQIKAVAFRQRLAKAGGGLGIQVQTFYGLYADILTAAAAARGGAPMPRLFPVIRRRLIRHLLARLSDDGQLTYYAAVRDTPGFVRLLADLFQELKRARIFPEALTVATAEDSPRLSELARLYDAYQKWLIDHGWADAEGQGWLAAIALQEDQTLLSDLALLAVDGFDEFNPTQLAVLRLLSARARETVVTLTSDLDRPNRLAHRRFARARQDLMEVLGAEPELISLDSPSATPLSHLETHLFEPGAAIAPAGDTILCIEAQNRAAEAREALRWVKARLVRQNLPPSQVAIVARDITPYRPFLEEVAAEFGLPLHFAAGLPLTENPAIVALRNLLALPLPTVDWSPRALRDALTSPYFDWESWGLAPGDADRLWDVACAGQVMAGLDQWRETLARLADRPASASDEAIEPPGQDNDLLPRQPPVGDEAVRLTEVLDAIAARVTPPTDATLSAQVAWLEGLIGDDPLLASGPARHTPADDVSLHIVARARENPATAERDVVALQALKDILRGMVLFASLTFQPDGPLSYTRFLTDLFHAIEEGSYSLPAKGEAVLVTSVADVRGLTFDTVALLGLAEGELPRAEREDVLLRESDRAALRARDLPIKPRLHGDEPSFFYQAVTRARRHLLLCRPYLADDGQPWPPSPYWQAVRALFTDLETRHIRPTDPIIDAASPQEQAAAVPNEMLAHRLRFIHRRGDLSAVDDRLAARFGPDQPWSSSRLETYARCPYYFWTAYGMLLKPREVPQTGFDALILGSIYHLVLEKLYQRVPDGDPDQLRAELPRVAQAVYDTAPTDHGFRPGPLWERQQEELTEALRRTVEGLIETAGEYHPMYTELPFGMRGSPPLEVPGEPGLQLRGYIDRVDRAPDGSLRIIDYKAGSTPITPRDLDDGRRLQLPLYALAAERALGAEVTSGFYWHIGAAQPSRLQLETYQGGVSGAVEKAVAYARAVVTAVRAGQFAPAPPADGCPSFCPAADFCERYRPPLWS